MTQGGSGPVFAFLHGGGQGGWVWDEVVDELRRRAPDVAVLALDVPGCGAKRGRDTSGLSIPEVVAELAADLDASGLSGVVLVGHSQAGTVLPALAESRPAAISRLIHVSCCAPAPGQTVRQMMGAGLHGERPEAVGWPVDPQTASPQALAAAMFCNDMDEAQTQAFLARLGADAWPTACGVGYDQWRYGAASQPVTYVLLERDASLPPQWQLKFAERQGAERVVRLDAGHQAMQTQPGPLAEILLAEAALNSNV